VSLDTTLLACGRVHTAPTIHLSLYHLSPYLPIYPCIYLSTYLPIITVPALPPMSSCALATSSHHEEEEEAEEEQEQEQEQEQKEGGGGGGGEAAAGLLTIAATRHQVEWNDDVLGSDISRDILSGLRPSLVFSAHTHRPCAILHHGGQSGQNGQQLAVGGEGVEAGAGGQGGAAAAAREITLPTMAWRMRPDAGYAIA